MRIAVISPYALDVPGGVQEQCTHLVTGLNEKGHDAWLVGPGRWGPDGSRLVSLPVSVPANRSLVPLGLDPRLVARLADAAEGAEVVHVHEPLAPLMGWAALRLASPLVGTFHADPPGWVRRLYRLGRPPIQTLLRRLSAATAVSMVAARAIEPFVPEVEVVPNGVHLRSFRSGERIGSRVAFLGRDEPRKGLDLLLSAWPFVLGAVPEAELVVMGVDRPTLVPRVHFLGRVDHDRKADELAVTDVLCAPNLGSESFGIVLVEAMAAGCAVVASDLPAFRATLGSAGRLVPAGDVVALARALIDVLGDSVVRRKYREAGRRRARSFDWSVVLPRYERIYQRIAVTT